MAVSCSDTYPLPVTNEQNWKSEAASPFGIRDRIDVPASGEMPLTDHQDLQSCVYLRGGSRGG
ncbi:hypothetical protein CI238_08160, partial [Colletotrichum incanum]